jgi:hypothetical protein
VLGDIPASLGASPAGAESHQCRHPDRPQEVTHVNLEVGAKAPIGALRRGGQAFTACEPACEPGVTGHAGSPATERPGSPPVSYPGYLCLNAFLPVPFRIVVRAPETGTRVDEQQRGRPLGVGGGELQRRRAGSRAEHDYPLGAELVEYDDHVVDDALNQAALHRRDRIR